jgi:hypothetical protein
MALDALWAVLIPEVSRVSQVQAPIHAGLAETPTFLPEVSGVSSNDSSEAVTTILIRADTPATPPENVRYQREPSLALGCTLDTPDTSEKINTKAHATNDLLFGEQLTAALIEPKRVFGRHGPWFTDTEQSAARTYHMHHFNCNTCIAAGRGNRYGNRCTVGLALWNNYQVTDQITG